MIKVFSNTFLKRTGVLLFAVAVASSCGPNPKDRPDVRRAAANGYYGGLFRMNIADDIRSIFPHNIVDAAAFNLMNQVYEGLVRIDRETKEIAPALAERYEVSADGKTYRFFLRKGVYFHSDQVFGEVDSREMRASDVAYCFKRLCEPGDYNQLYAFMIDVVKGGRKHYESGATGIKSTNGPTGIRVVDEYTLEVELEFPIPNFLTILTHPCCWVFPKELYQYGKEVNNWAVGTGPFKVRTVKPNEVMILERNQNYWQEDAEGNQLPYLEAIRCNFEGNTRTQLSAFFDGHLDLILQIPFGELAAVVNSIEQQDYEEAPFRIMSSPGLRVEYYGFQHRSEQFGDERVRRAFNMAIDRDHIVNEVLKGYAIPAHHGFVPDRMPGYPAREVQGFSFRPDSARKLLAAAGYPNGKGFPVITIQANDGNETALEVAEVVQEMLAQHLNLTVEISVLSRDRHYDQIENGVVDFWRDGWIADYPDPENFLKLFHGKLVPGDSVKASYLNTVRFKDADFDQYFEAAIREPDKEARMELFRKADQKIIDKAAVVPLYYEKWLWLSSGKVRNLSVGNMGELELKRVYFSNAVPERDATPQL